jgi:hypothetical protein
LTRKLRTLGAAINAIAKANQSPRPHQLPQCAEYLILTAEISELTRQEHVITLAGDPRFHPLP